MSKWFERPVIRLLMFLAGGLVGGLVIGAPAVLAQDDGQPPDQEAKASAKRERAMISTGLGSDAIASQWPDAAVWLEPPEEDRVLALFEPEADTPAKGALVILADEGQSAASGLAGALRGPMARAGWAVMTVGLESPPYGLQRARRQQPSAPPDEPQESTEEDGEADASESVMIDVMDNVDVEELEDQYRTRIQKALSAAVGNVADRGYGRVAVVGIGRAAGHVARMTAGGGGDVSALVWIAPVFDHNDSAALTEWLGAAGQIRLLELHSSREAGAQDGVGSRTPEQREAAFRRAGIKAYTRQPVAMADRPEPRDAPALANRLAAWLASDR